MIGENQSYIFQTQGIHPFFMDEEKISSIIQQELMIQLQSSLTLSVGEDRVRFDEIFFYGAGCVNEKKVLVKNALSKKFSARRIEVESDLLAAAHATANKENGMVIIVGTGSNSGLYDGKNFIEQIPSLGYLLGDEASGSWLGKKIIADYFRKNLPSGIFIQLEKILPSKNFAEFLTHLYQQPHQGKYLAQFAKVIVENKSDAYCKSIVEKGFQALFENVIRHYSNYQTQKIFAVGSIAFYFEKELRDIAAQHKMTIGKIIQSPINGLIEYHQ